MSAIDYEAESAKRLNWLDITGGGAKDSLTVLDYFAGKALAGMLAGNVDLYDYEKAEWAYEIAEEMLKARNKRFISSGTIKGVTGKTYG